MNIKLHGPKTKTHARTRTVSSRKRAGSRKGNGGMAFLSDLWPSRNDTHNYRVKPDHGSRAVSITTCYQKVGA